jgi:hypothetical protein
VVWQAVPSVYDPLTEVIASDIESVAGLTQLQATASSVSTSEEGELGVLCPVNAMQVLVYLLHLLYSVVPKSAFSAFSEIVTCITSLLLGLLNGEMRPPQVTRCVKI